VGIHWHHSLNNCSFFFTSLPWKTPYWCLWRSIWRQNSLVISSVDWLTDHPGTLLHPGSSSMEVSDDLPLYYVAQGLTAVISEPRPNHVPSTSVIVIDSKRVKRHWHRFSWDEMDTFGYFLKSASIFKTYLSVCILEEIPIAWCTAELLGHFWALSETLTLYRQLFMELVNAPPPLLPNITGRYLEILLGWITL